MWPNACKGNNFISDPFHAVDKMAFVSVTFGKGTAVTAPDRFRLHQSSSATRSKQFVTSKRSKIKMTGTNKLSSVDSIEWISKPVTISGKVQRGFQRGRQLGFPTANLPGHILKGIEEANRDGVYVGYALVPKLSLEPMKMVSNLGRNITFDDVEQRVFEAHLLPKDLPQFYDEEIHLCLIGFLRPELKFDSIDELVLHIKNDVEVASKILDLPNAKPYLKYLQALQ